MLDKELVENVPIDLEDNPKSMLDFENLRIIRDRSMQLHISIFKGIGASGKRGRAANLSTFPRVLDGNTVGGYV